jgi:ferredoxin
MHVDYDGWTCPRRSSLYGLITTIVAAAACIESAPEVFAHKDGICHIKDGAEMRNGPDTLVAVSEANKEKVIEAAENCPGECIFIEIA